jgi:hypothetical protein
MAYTTDMKATCHDVRHAYQSTNNNCSQTALAILLSQYDHDTTADEIIAQVPVQKDENGDDYGSINPTLADWCLEQGFAVDLYTFDCQAIDLSWGALSRERLLERIEAAMHSRDVPSLGPVWSQIYLQAYVDFVSDGGELHIRPHVTSKLLYELLEKGPILPSVCYSTLYNEGRSRNIALRESVYDDVAGKVINHSIVIYGNDEDGNFLVADPWKGMQVIEPERMLCSITAAQIECDNLLFQLHKK